MRTLDQRACERCMLQDADLVHADLRDARLQGAQLERANLSGARLDGADLRESNLRFTGQSPSRSARAEPFWGRPPTQSPGGRAN